jgi:hypothetical protein
MTCIIATTPNRSISAKLAAGAFLAALFAVGTFAAPANADWDGYQKGYNHNWNGGYYRAPPIVYGSSYGSSYYGSPYYGSLYNYPPVVYGPGIGIGLPGFSIGIR